MKSSTLSSDDAIIITRASENNLKSISLRIPKNQYILVTGVSGSGKSSLVHDVIASEGKRRFLEQQNPRVRTILSGIHPPVVDEIKGMSPVVSLDQISASHTIRSTVGTLSGLYDFLRLLMSRYGRDSEGIASTTLTRSHFSFNLPAGACEHCQGLGKEEYIDPETFIADPDKSVLDGALSLTNPNGYIIYSQVTLDVLQEVCKAEGFPLDRPWKDLSDSEKEVIFYGSDLIKVAFGKHTLESRMRWTGITAKPRDEGYYRGILTIMEEILRRDRNANILKYTRSRECPICKGYRLQQHSLEVLWKGKHIGEWASLAIEELHEELKRVLRGGLAGGERRVLEAIVQLTNGLIKLGLGYLCLNRESRTLSGGENKRIRLATMLQSGLSGLIYTLDEPTVGLHPADHNNLLNLLQEVQQRGNTLVCIDHKFFSFNRADYWIEMGPKAGYLGGQVILEGPMRNILQSTDIQKKSATWEYFSGKKKLCWSNSGNSANGFIEISGARAHNLRSISPRFKIGALNVICGVSGAGKTTLLYNILNNYFADKQNVDVDDVNYSIPIKKTIWVDQAPIGRTPRSNPATYIKLFDRIRDLFASLDAAREAGFTKSHFSFNVDRGRCPVCHGAGKIELGLSYLGKTEAPCDTCLGRRFKPDILDVTWRGQNIAQVLDMEIDKAYEFFFDQPKIRKYLELLHDLGLGYLKLGQSSSTLSGGEAQRIKLVSELVKGKSQHCLYLLDEPTNGLHYADIAILLKGLEKLVSNGNTLILVEHDPYLINIADWVVELGPGGGLAGGKLVFEGTPESLLEGETLMAHSIRESHALYDISLSRSCHITPAPKEVQLQGVTTHNLQNLDVKIPHREITAITGVSGSGKTSLAFDTLLASANYLFAQAFSPYVRTQLGGNESGEVENITGLLPAIGMKSSRPVNVKYSTVATLLGLSSSLRLLFSRFSVTANGEGSTLWANHFSFLHPSGACPECHGLGYQMETNEQLLINNDHLSLFEGAMKGSRPGDFFSDPKGQYMAILLSMAAQHHIELQKPWHSFSDQEKQLILYGTDDEEYEVDWNFQRKNREGQHHFISTWPGFIPLIHDDYKKKAGTTRQKTMEDILVPVLCNHCRGFRIRPDRLEYEFLGKDYAEWLSVSITELKDFLDEKTLPDKLSAYPSDQARMISVVFFRMRRVASFMVKLGLGYLSLNRSTHTLSTGEYQRTRLAGQLISGLSNMLLILDEPGASLHPANLVHLQRIFEELIRMGNTIVFTEHNQWLVDRANNVIELGPGGGANGGKIISTRNRKGISQARYDQPTLPLQRRGFLSSQLFARITGIRFRNLKIDKLDMPLGWISVCGVSGSGKSTLVSDVIALTLKNSHGSRWQDSFTYCENYRTISGTQQADRWNWYRTPLHELGLDTYLYKCLCQSSACRDDGIKPGFFRPTAKGGRCETCQGKGYEQKALDFLGSAVIPCSDCNGTGYKPSVLRYEYQGLTLPDCLKLSLSELVRILPDFSFKNKVEQLMASLELGYLTSGQHGQSLSGGERQRLVLTRQLLDTGSEQKVILFDEPTRGLDARSLSGYCDFITDLARQKNMIVSIDHDARVISRADWIIELGPAAGEEGGQVIFEGSPHKLLQKKHPTPTGAAIAEYLK